MDVQEFTKVLTSGSLNLTSLKGFNSLARKKFHMSQYLVSTIIKNLIPRSMNYSLLLRGYCIIMLLLVNHQNQCYESLYVHLLVDKGKHEFSQK